MEGPWRRGAGNRGRSIAAIVAHMQGVPRMFTRMGSARPGPPSLDRNRSTPVEARRALRQSTEALAGLFETATAARQMRVKGTPRRLVNMLVYLMLHDAHHRGQISATEPCRASRLYLQNMIGSERRTLFLIEGVKS
jgi:uncharacterized damage-inducible protein DinB